MRNRLFSVALFAVPIALGGCSSSPQPDANGPAAESSQNLGVATQQATQQQQGFAHSKLLGLFNEADVDKDGKVTLQEAQALAASRFAAADTNHDGLLDATELSAMRQAMWGAPRSGSGRSGSERNAADHARSGAPSVG